MSKLGYIEVAGHPLTVALKSNYKELLNEFNILSQRHIGLKPNNVMGEAIDQKESNGKELYSGQIWSAFTRVAEESCSEKEYKALWGDTEESKVNANKRLLAKQKLTPVLESILEPYHPYVGTVGFNLMAPGAKLSMHYGMVSAYVRFHLGLVCDPEAKFLVNSYPARAWTEGDVWAFDDGDAFHGTLHNGTINRLILLVDIHRDAFENLEEEKYIPR
jgi:hypothetical protein